MSRGGTENLAAAASRSLVGRLCYFRWEMTSRPISLVLPILLAVATCLASAQVVPSAFDKGLSIRAGGIGSVFQPDYTGYGDRKTSPSYLVGMGAFVDVKFTKWIQVEAEGRWLRFNQYDQIHQDNYLAGPRVPIYPLHFWRATPYAKALIGAGRLTFENNNGWGRYTAIAYGGGIDIKLTSRINLRAIDFENQVWPRWVEPGYPPIALWPYGVSAGVSYRVLGRR